MASADLPAPPGDATTNPPPTPAETGTKAGADRLTPPDGPAAQDPAADRARSGSEPGGANYGSGSYGSADSSTGRK